MKWFKHDTDANQDAKLKRLRMKYGLEGYGLYWYCIELIAGSVDQNNLTFELDHDAEIIGFDTGIHQERVEEMMTYMVRVGLFENTQGVITCMKLAKRLDQSMTSSPQMRSLIKALHDKGGMVGKRESALSHDPVMTQSCKTRQDKTRPEKTLVASSDATNVYPDEFEELWAAYPKRKGSSKKPTYKAWNARIRGGADAGEILRGVKDYARYCEHHGKMGTEFVKLAQTFMGPGEHYLADWGISDCPHLAIVDAWNEELPAHIQPVDHDAWSPGATGRARLEESWEILKAKPRSKGDGMVIQDAEQGARWFRAVFRRLAKSPRLLDETSAQWCKLSWAVKNETIHEIAQGAYDQ